MRTNKANIKKPTAFHTKISFFPTSLVTQYSARMDYIRIYLVAYFLQEGAFPPHYPWERCQIADCGRDVARPPRTAWSCGVASIQQLVEGTSKNMASEQPSFFNGPRKLSLGPNKLPFHQRRRPPSWQRSKTPAMAASMLWRALTCPSQMIFLAPETMPRQHLIKNSELLERGLASFLIRLLSSVNF